MSTHRIFVGNLSTETTEEEIKSEFSSCGEIESADLITEKATGRSRGFAFVSYKEASSLPAAIEKNGNPFNGKPLRVEAAGEKKPRE
ncbi:MAG: cold-inducible RNA-binding protein [Candidatus Marinamargulisbacteria bacterium]|jgi:cold-inducible RNA-binding protein